MPEENAAPESAATDPSAPTEPPPAPRPVAPEKRTPDAWAREYFPASDRGRPHPALWRHAGAAALHQWALEAHHAGKPLELTRADYEAALEAAAKPNPAPHPGALGPHTKKG